MVCRKMQKGQEKEKDWLDQRYGLRRKRVYIDNGRTETENNCESH